METIDENKIIEGNKLIAAFFGKGKFSYYGHGLNLYGTPHYPINKIRYHNSWDWLMPVYRKIKDILQNIERPSKNHSCHGDIIEVDIHCAVTDIDIKTAFIHIVEFIEWYNLSKYNV